MNLPTNRVFLVGGGLCFVNSSCFVSDPTPSSYPGSNPNPNHHATSEPSPYPDLMKTWTKPDLIPVLAELLFPLPDWQ